jgi:hypothetical protein
MGSEAEEFLGLDPEREPGTEEEAGVPFRQRAWTLAITWLVALAVTCPHPKGIMFLPFFPVGPFFFVQSLEAAWPILWIVYLFLGIAILSVQTKRAFQRLLLVLIVLLLVNVVGCRAMMREFGSRFN